MKAIDNIPANEKRYAAFDLSGVIQSDESTWYSGGPKDDGSPESKTERTNWVNRRTRTLHAVGKGPFAKTESEAPTDYVDVSKLTHDQQLDKILWENRDPEIWGYGIPWSPDGSHWKESKKVQK